MILESNMKLLELLLPFLIYLVYFSNAEKIGTLELDFFLGTRLGKKEYLVSGTKQSTTPDSYFDQKLDHFNASNKRTWKQVIKKMIVLRIKYFQKIFFLKRDIG